MAIKKILLFSTLNPYPFWAGSENFWFDLVADKRANENFKFHLVLADSPVTRKKAEILSAHGITTSFFKHFNVSVTVRNFYRLVDKLGKRKFRSLPWYNEIKKNNYDLVWFNVAALPDLPDLYYAIQLCKKQKTPYWLLVQHCDEDFFFTSSKEIEMVTEIADSATKFIFIAKKNRYSLERAIGKKLSNAFHSGNALPAEKIEEAKRIGKNNLPAEQGTAKFFNLGRFSPKDKAQHLLLEAFSSDKWKGRDWVLTFIGVSDFGADYLKRLLGFYKLDSNKINIIHPTENVFEEMVKHDVLLMPSLAEGTPFAMIESMACGRPALGTPIGGIPELILEKKTGWLTATTNIKDISDKLEEVWNERSNWAEYGLNAQKHVEENYNEERSFIPLLESLRNDTE